MSADTRYDNAVRRIVSAGRTCPEAALDLGIPLNRVWGIVLRLSLHPTLAKRGRKPLAKARRPHSSRAPRELFDDRVRAAIEGGSTYSEAARAIGISMQRVRQIAIRLGVLPPRDGRHENNKCDDPRAPLIAALYRDGYTLQQIGEQYGVSRERIRQILRKRTTVLASDGGQALKTRRHRAEVASARDRKYMTRLGCGFAEYLEIRHVGREMMAAGTRRERTPMGAFCRQKHNAGTRGIGWELTFWQWWSIWQQSGHWSERGRGQGYVMCRKGDLGPYAIQNVFIATARENSSQTKNKKSGLPVGVSVRNGRFIASRMVNRRDIYLGTHATPELAHAAYLAADPAISQRIAA